MLGKKKCKMLREIRRQIANENDIPYVTEDCKYKGDCKGTCPKCESELRYLEEQLEKRRALGIKVTVSALAVGLITTSAGCRTAGYTQLDGDVPYTQEADLGGAVAPDDCDPTDGQDDIEVLEGEVAEEPTEDETADTEVLEGDAAAEPTEESSSENG